jgi:hypothetical protein
VLERYGNRGLFLVAFDMGLEQDGVCPATGLRVVVTGFRVLEEVVVAVASLVTGTYRSERHGCIFSFHVLVTVLVLCVVYHPIYLPV